MSFSTAGKHARNSSDDGHDDNNERDSQRRKTNHATVADADDSDESDGEEVPNKSTQFKHKDFARLQTQTSKDRRRDLLRDIQKVTGIKYILHFFSSRCRFELRKDELDLSTNLLRRLLALCILAGGDIERIKSLISRAVASRRFNKACLLCPWDLHVAMQLCETQNAEMKKTKTTEKEQATEALDGPTEASSGEAGLRSITPTMPTGLDKDPAKAQSAIPTDTPPAPKKDGKNTKDTDVSTTGVDSKTPIDSAAKAKPATTKPATIKPATIKPAAKARTGPDGKVPALPQGSAKGTGDAKEPNDDGDDIEVMQARRNLDAAVAAEKTKNFKVDAAEAAERTVEARANLELLLLKKAKENKTKKDVQR
ncbi:hypothetical protein LTR56_018427 [Elasticomyces elasticus]|nr:hypothetical protein LTR56_018427 [Elasticomyces elasticus]KAK3655793.1 hypothetical protein LTR22_010087 [Elasticomyces elasticus]KAK4912007.1 hypothetical protein LTR49_019477 [Elasticomyces elasticus]KAK5756782.1 hypothetical protein LTS12_013115 [Elasticomyces elasticus]